MMDVSSFLIVEAIIRSGNNIAETINSIPNGSYLLATYSGLLSGISAFVAALSFDFFKSRDLKDKNKKKKIANIAYKSIEEFEKISVTYWIQNKNKKNSHQQEMLEVSIKLSFLSISNLIDEIKNNHKLDGDDLSFIEENWLEVFDIAMGGDFEVSHKKSCKERAVNLTSILSKIKLVLLRYDY